MPKPRQVTVTLSEEVVGAADELAATRACSRSALVENALRWYLRVQDLAWDEASPEEIEAIERGRAEIASGEFVTFEEIKRDLESWSSRTAHREICESFRWRIAGASTGRWNVEIVDYHKG